MPSNHQELFPLNETNIKIYTLCPSLKMIPFEFIALILKKKTNEIVKIYFSCFNSVFNIPFDFTFNMM